MMKQFLNSFSCVNDEDIEEIESFVEDNFEKLSKSRTYLVCDEEDLKHNTLDKVIIYGYISIALKTLTIPEETSNRMRKELDGFNAKIHGEPIRDIPCYLIGQLSRNSNIPKDILNGAKLLEYAYSVIVQSVDAGGGRYIMIECHDNQKLIHFYQQNLFKEIARIPDKNIPMVQMIRKIQ